MSFSPDINACTPNTGDSSDLLDSKWRNFTVVESCKRSIIQLLSSHDVLTGL